LAKVVHSKRSGMDHTVLPANNTMPAFPSWAFTRCHHHSNLGSGHPNCSSLLIYRPRKDERLSWPETHACVNNLSRVVKQQSCDEKSNLRTFFTFSVTSHYPWEESLKL